MSGGFHIPKTRATYVRACRLFRERDMRHIHIHRRQQIALVLLRYRKGWRSKLALSLIAKYEGSPT